MDILIWTLIGMTAIAAVIIISDALKDQQSVKIKESAKINDHADLPNVVTRHGARVLTRVGRRDHWNKELYMRHIERRPKAEVVQTLKLLQLNVRK